MTRAAVSPETLAAIRQAGTMPQLPGSVVPARPLDSGWPLQPRFEDVRLQLYWDFLNDCIVRALLREGVPFDTPYGGGVMWRSPEGKPT